MSDAWDNNPNIEGIVINQVGSSNMNIPSSISRGDTFVFNVTNIDTSTRYTGTIMSYTFPYNCTVTIRAYGARGGIGNLYTYGWTDTCRPGYGSYCYGTFTFQAGETILILVGQPGADAHTGTNRTRDCTSGCGGGATTIAKRVASSSYKFVGSLDNGSNIYTGWYVEPLIVAAGGNGSRDNGYSGTGKIYDAFGHTTSKQSLGVSSTSSTYCVGGAFSLEAGMYSSSSYPYGRSFLSGGLGSKYSYSRNGKRSYAGFGGGGANKDDGEGGGGGGWISGYTRNSAYSYINTNLATAYGSTAAYGTGRGIVGITFEVVGNYPKIYTKNSSDILVPSEEQHVYVNDSLKFKRVKEIYIKNSSGLWVKNA